MSLILILSIAIRLVAVIWAVVIWRRLRDWRMVFLVIMLCLMATRQSLTLWTHGQHMAFHLPGSLTELPGLAVSLMALLAVGFIHPMIDERRQTRHQLQKSRELFESFMEHLPAVAFMKDANGRYLFVNQAAGRVFHRPPPDWIGQTPSDLWPDSIGEKIRQQDERVLQQGQPVEQIQAIPVDGVDHRWLIIKFPFEDIDGRRCVAGMAIDFTRRAAAERELELRYQAVQAAGHGILVLDAQAEGHPIVYVNQAFERHTGYRAEEVLGRNPPFLQLHEQDQPAIQEVREAIRQGQEVCAVMRNYRKDGQMWWNELYIAPIQDEQGQPIHLVGIQHDVTQRKQAEEAVQRHAQFTELIATISTGFIDIEPDQVDARVRQALEDLGRFADVDRTYLFLLHDRGKIFDCAYEWCAQGIRAEADRLRHLRSHDFPFALGTIRKGEILHVPRVNDLPASAQAEKEEWQAEQIQSLINIPLIALGEVIGFIGFDSVRKEKAWSAEETGQLKIVGEIFIDALHHRQVVQQREQLVKKLEATNAELERFTYTVSHDLKSPLITIKGFLSLLEQDISDGDTKRWQADMQQIRTAADTMQRLLDELLELSQIGRVGASPVRVPLDEVIQEALSRVAGQIEQRGVKVAIEPGLPVVVGDRPRLVELIQNLVDNAIKFMGDQPLPRVEITTQPHAPQQIVVRVKDNGIGIEPRFHQKIFGLFERLDPNVNGTGIGLALVKRIVDVHGQRIWVESEGNGRGATFCFTMASEELSN